MTVAVETWEPEVFGADIGELPIGAVGLLPVGSGAYGLEFDDATLTIPKLATREGHSVVFAGDPDPHFRTEYSAGAEVPIIALVVQQLVTAETVEAIRFVLRSYLGHSGWHLNLGHNPQLTVKLAKRRPDGTLEGLEMSGDASAVNEALTTLVNE